LLRPTNADLNMTLAMALLAMATWLYWTISEVGVMGFIKHTFGVKGGLKGFMAIALAPLFVFVGFIEIVSIAFRPVSLSIRLFGNIYSGENLLHTMANLGGIFGLPNWASFIMSLVIPIPFYFLELLVGLLQALVFTLLCAVYIQLSTAHEEGHEEAHAH
jgi:F-type H+-transporting ATPase subunit a